MAGERAKLTTEITDLIERTTELAAQLSHAAAGLIGVNTTDLQCIQLLQHGPLTAGELARLTGLTTASITGVIDRLEAAGLAVRRRDTTDRRRVLVESTDRAGAELESVFRPLIRAWREAVAGYDERDLRLIADFLAGVGGAFSAELTRLRGRLNR